MTWTPSDDLVEQGAAAWWAKREEDARFVERTAGMDPQPEPWESLSPSTQESVRVFVRDTLAAVGPLIAAQAWDEAANAVVYPAIDESRSRMTLRAVIPVPENPYRQEADRG